MASGKHQGASLWSRSAIRHSLLVLFIGIGVASGAQDQAQSRISQTIDLSRPVVLQGSSRSFAKPEFDAGRVDGSMKIDGISLVFNLSAEQQAALQTLLREQQDRSSSNYHKWLTPEEFGERFGMSQGDLAKVSSWLQSQGFEVKGVSRNRTRISFSGTAAQVETAFLTQMHHYLVNGETHFANATALSVPAAIANTVLAVTNLSDLRARPRSVATQKPFSRLSPHYTDTGTGDHYLAPADFATIYDLNPLYTAGFDGTGQSIAIMGQTAIYTADIDAFRSAAGLPARTSSNFQQIQVPNTGSPVVSSTDLIEADLDLEWAEAVAPNVTLIYVYVGNAQNADAFDALDYAVENISAPVISITYGSCEQDLGLTESNVIQQEAITANSQGQTIIAASGDSGAADCDGKAAEAQYGLAVDVPAAIPEVTGVGGTEFTGDVSSTTTTTYWNATNGPGGSSAISYIPEIAWDDTELDQALSASGGGASTFYPKPSWQVGTNVPEDSARDVPDIALSASSAHDPYLVCSNQTVNSSCTSGFGDGHGNFLSTGGTSFGAPAFAGVVALINQRTQSSQGNLNPTLYTLAASTPTAFHDITTGSNDVPCEQGSPDCPGSGIMGYVAGTGYDQVTGLGSIDGSVLVNAWPIAYSLAASPTTVNITAAGDQGTAAVTLTSNVGFTGTVTLACTPQSGVYGLTCQISPATLSATSTTATLTISTVGPSSELSVPTGGPGKWLLGIGSTLCFGVLLLEIPFSCRRRIGGATFILFALLAIGMGCGGSPSSSTTPTPVQPTPDPSTPAGNYTIQVTGTSGSTSFSMNVTASVQ